VVEVDGRSFAAHRVVLASACDYFNRHYDNEHMRGADHPKLLEHVTAAAFEPLLAFLYEGACTFDESLLAPVLRAANFLNVAPLEKAAVVALKERLSPSNALTAWTWGEELELPELAEAAKVTALEGFDEVEKIEEATLAQMQALVADDRLTAKSEEAVFSAVARFAEAKKPAEADLLGLLRNVRFPLMSESFVLETVHRWPRLDTAAGQGLLVEQLVPKAGPARQSRLGFGPRTLYVLGGQESGGDEASSVEIYDSLTNSWVAGPQLPEARCQAAAAVLDGKMYVMGGEQLLTTLSDVRVLDPQVGTWEAVAPMATARQGFTSAAVGGKLYAIGGYDKRGRSQTSVEAFDPQTGVWTEVAPMPTARDFLGAAVLHGQIYVIGGESVSENDDFLGIKDTVGVYDPATNAWTAAPPIGTARCGHGVAALGGKIYVAGGASSIRQHFDTVEVFDPQTNRWTNVAPMSKTRSSFSLTAARGKLYAVGGSSENLATAEAYDPKEDRWEAVAPLAAGRKSHMTVGI